MQKGRERKTKSTKGKEKGGLRQRKQASDFKRALFPQSLGKHARGLADAFRAVWGAHTRSFLAVAG